jgi:hypothetical protein
MNDEGGSQSSSELIALISAAERQLNSVERITHQTIRSDDGTTEETIRHIVVGEDWYYKKVSSDGSTQEQLYFGGKRYSRDPEEGRWLPDPSAAYAIQTHAIPADVRSLYGFALQALKDVTVHSGNLSGTSVIVLSGEAAFELRNLLPAGASEALSTEGKAWIPRSVTVRVTLSVDPTTYYVLSMTSETLLDNRPAFFASSSAISIFSNHGEAQIPRPSPE